MRDFDFDEIDRAVASTMQPDQSDNVPVSNGDSSRPASQPAPAVRRSGRFMDVVHPSSDMRNSPTPERDRTTVEAESSRDELRVPEREDAGSSSTDMPDPLDFHGFNTDAEQSESEEPKEYTPQESPFIPNAQIEKRPLGGYPTQDDVPAPIATEEITEAVEQPEQESPVPDEVEPNENTEDVSKEEVQDNTVESTQQEVEPEPTVEEQSQPEQQPQQPEPEQHTGPVAITQQYKERPSTTDQPSGAIYDTESYHQPLSKPVKKKSGIWVVLWIFGLIVVGAGAGAAVYFFVLPML